MLKGPYILFLNSPRVLRSSAVIYLLTCHIMIKQKQKAVGSQILDQMVVGSIPGWVTIK